MKALALALLLPSLATAQAARPIYALVAADGPMVPGIARGCAAAAEGVQAVCELSRAEPGAEPATILAVIAHPGVAGLALVVPEDGPDLASALATARAARIPVVLLLHDVSAEARATRQAVIASVKPATGGFTERPIHLGAAAALVLFQLAQGNQVPEQIGIATDACAPGCP